MSILVKSMASCMDARRLCDCGGGGVDGISVPIIEPPPQYFSEGKVKVTSRSPGMEEGVPNPEGLSSTREAKVKVISA